MSNHITVPLTKGQVAIIDECDQELANHNWYAIEVGDVFYAARDIRENGNRKTLYLHREVLSKMLGRSLVTGEKSDHISGDTQDNTRQNIRLATHQENIHNSKKSRNNKSGYKGVCWHKMANKWRAYITLNRKQIHLGLFETAELAYSAYCEAAKKYHGEFARFK